VEGLGEPAQFPTSVKDVVTLLGNAQWPISNGLGVRVTRSISAVSSALKCSMGPRYAAGECLTSSLCVRLGGHGPPDQV
jgi:hypothetical protein